MDEIKLRDYQIKVCDRTIDAYNEGHKSVMVESPTGSGKTVMALSILKAMGLKKIGWVTRRPSLLAQVIKENERHYGLKFHTFTMYKKNPPSNLDILIVDEAHCDATASMNNIYEISNPKLVLGLSATPIRHDKAILPYGKTVKEAGYTQLIINEYLANFNHFTLTEYTVNNVVNTYLKFKEKFGKTAMFFLTRREAVKAADLLRKAGVIADSVSGDDSQAEHKIDAFRNNKLEVITNIFLLTEGFDCLSSDTEILTENGWKTYGEINIQDKVFSLNKDNEKMELSKIEAINSRPLRTNENFVTIKSQHLDIKVTEGHEFHIKYRNPLNNGKLSDNFIIRTASQMAERHSSYALPLSADFGYNGVDLSDDEIKFIGWFLTDGSKSRSDITISQSENSKKHANHIRTLLKKLKFDFGERSRLNKDRKGVFYSKYNQIEFRIPRGNNKSLPRNGWNSLFSYLNKSGSKSLNRFSRKQFKVLWKEMLLGDGSQRTPNHSGWINCGLNKQLADFISMMAITRGFASQVSEDKSPNGVSVWRVTARDTQWIISDPRDKRASKININTKYNDNYVWCLKNSNSTIIIRRNGKTAIVGNCPDLNTVFIRDTYSPTAHLQMCGRVLRPFNGAVKNIVESKNSKRSIVRRFQGVPQIPYTRFKQIGMEFDEMGKAKQVDVIIDKVVRKKLKNIKMLTNSPGMLYLRGKLGNLSNRENNRDRVNIRVNIDQ